ncbi:MAG: ABC transporter ATP-binding protein [Promethearchaeota archaeon]
MQRERKKHGKGKKNKARVFSFTKPYLPMIFLSIGLLFVQATYCDLALPDYLSDIVNVGIQQNGIPNAVPEAINETEMDRVTLFLTPANKSHVLGNYTLVGADSPDYDAYLKKYPALENTSVYVLNDVNASVVDALNPVMAGALLVVYTIEQALTNETLAAELGGYLGVNMSALPPGMDIFTVLASMPPESLVEMNEAITSRLSSIGEKMVIQAAAKPISNIYRGLGMDTDKIRVDYILRVGAIMLLLTFASVSISITVGYLASKTATGMSRDMRRALFSKVENFTNAEFDSFSTASLITRSTNDITQIQQAVIMMIRLVFYAPIIGVGGIIRALGKAPSMWWIITLAVVVLVCIVVTVFSVALPKFKSIQKLVDRLNLVARESLTGIMVVRAFNRQEFEEERFDAANKDLTRVSLFINRVMVVMMPVMMMIMNGVTISVLWFGAHEVADAHMQVGDMMAFMQYSIQIVFAFLMMSLMFIIVPRAAVSGNRISEVLKTKPAIVDPEKPRHFPEPFRGTVEFKGVSFRYPGAEEDALHEISFVARPGETTAFIGATGAGKSTLVNLIPRFYDPTRGTIAIDGVDIREVTQRELRDKIGYVPQKSALFSGTIASNLLFANEDATEEDILSAIEIAQASEFVTSKPRGVHAEISQGGANVSGGQKQRLSIARALVKKPPIYILDDSFSALDFKTDAVLRAAFRKRAAGSTLLIVTQRVSTIKDAEQIVVLDEGRIAGRGTHEELMESCEIYREIALSQNTREELS